MEKTSQWKKEWRQKNVEFVFGFTGRDRIGHLAGMTPGWHDWTQATIPDSDRGESGFTKNEECESGSHEHSATGDSASGAGRADVH